MKTKLSLIAAMLIGIVVTTGYFRAKEVYEDYRMCVSERNAHSLVENLRSEVANHKRKL